MIFSRFSYTCLIYYIMVRKNNKITLNWIECEKKIEIENKNSLEGYEI